MKESLAKITVKFAPLIDKLRRYKTLVFFVALLMVFGFLVLSINSLNNQEPSTAAIAQELQAVSRPRIDQAAIDKIEQLQDNSVEVQSLFKNSRKNPFQE